MWKRIDYALANGQLGGLDVGEFSIRFDPIFGIVDAWREVEDRGAMAIFGLEVKSKMTETDARLA